MSEENVLFYGEEPEIEFGSDKRVEEKDNDFGLITEGDYEVVLEKVEKKISAKNNEYLRITFSIREDVNQDFKRRKLWYTIFKRQNDPAFNFNKINEIIITQEGRKDYKRHFKELDEIFQYLVGLHLKLTVGIEFNNSKGDVNTVVDGSFSPSDADKEITADEFF